MEPTHELLERLRKIAADLRKASPITTTTEEIRSWEAARRLGRDQAARMIEQLITEFKDDYGIEEKP